MSEELIWSFAGLVILRIVQGLEQYYVHYYFFQLVFLLPYFFVVHMLDRRYSLYKLIDN